MKRVCIGMLLLSLVSCSPFLYDSTKIDEKVDMKLFEYASIGKAAEGVCHINFAEDDTNTLLECYFRDESMLKKAESLLQANINGRTDSKLQIMEYRIQAKTLYYHDSDDKNKAILKSILLEDTLNGESFFVEFSLCGVKLFEKIVNSLSLYRSNLYNNLTGNKIQGPFEEAVDVPIIKNWLKNIGQDKEVFFSRISADPILDRKILADQHQIAKIWFNNAEINSVKPIKESSKCMILLNSHWISTRQIDFTAFHNDPKSEELILKINSENLK